MSIAARSCYVHVPFCRSLCSYCDFYSEVLCPDAVHAYVDAVLAELEGWTRRQAFRFDTLYIGGGTPTVLPTAELERLISGLLRHVDPAERIEFTVEANPATVSDELARRLAQWDVSRVSLGAQSFVSAELQTLRRTHSVEQIASTVERCRRAGLAQLSLDLIFGIPGQTLATWQASLRAALTLAPDHISCYGLTYEPGTVLCQQRDAGEITPADNALEADMYEQAIDTLAAGGLEQYEISSFARPGRACRHNLRYWNNDPYLGLGPAAAGFVDEVRYTNVADTAAYVVAVQRGRSAWAESERLSPEHRARESAMLALRTRRGIERRPFATRYGVDPLVLFADAITKHVAAGRLVADAEGIRLTRAGLLLGDVVMADFL